MSPNTQRESPTGQASGGAFCFCCNPARSLRRRKQLDHFVRRRCRPSDRLPVPGCTEYLDLTRITSFSKGTLGGAPAGSRGPRSNGRKPPRTPLHGPSRISIGRIEAKAGYRPVQGNPRGIPWHTTRCRPMGTLRHLGLVGASCPRVVRESVKAPVFPNPEGSGPIGPQSNEGAKH